MTNEDILMMKNKDSENSIYSDEDYIRLHNQAMQIQTLDDIKAATADETSELAMFLKLRHDINCKPLPTEEG
jgi:hypothetical protein